MYRLVTNVRKRISRTSYSFFSRKKNHGSHQFGNNDSKMAWSNSNWDEYALTEILAKVAGLSASDLWGGKRRNVVPVYASLQSYSDHDDWITHSIKQVETVAKVGYKQMKVKVGGKSFHLP